MIADTPPAIVMPAPASATQAPTTVQPAKVQPTTAQPASSPAGTAAASTPADAAIINQAHAVAADAVPANSTGSASTPAVGHQDNVPAWRLNLHEKGIDFTFSYQSESAAVFTGGERGGTAYTQQLLLSNSIDTGKLFGLKGGKFTFTIIQRKGVDLTATRIGNLFEVQELYGGGQDVRPAELAYEQVLHNGRTAIKIGAYNSGADFATLPSGCNFENFAFCPRPTTLFYNSGFSGFPVPRWGFRVRQELFKGWYLTAAIFEVNSLRAATGDGWHLLPRLHSAIIPVELMWKTGQKPGQLPGLLRFGGLVDTTNKPDVYADANGNNYSLSGLPAATRTERWSAWVMGEKAIAHLGGKPAPGGTAGTLNVFATFTMSDLHTARVPYFASAGLSAKGFWKARPKDTAGIGVVYARVNPRTTDRELGLLQAGNTNTLVQTYEVSGELYYGLQMGPWLFRPNLQVIHHVDGSNRYPDAVVGGCTVKLVV